MWVASRLSESQRPILEEGELEFLLQDGITLAFERTMESLPKCNTKGVVYLTSYRIIWLEALESKRQTRVAMHLEHANVKTVLALAKPLLLGQPRLSVCLQDGTLFTLSFYSGGRERLLQKWEELLRDKPWLKQQPSTTLVRSTFTPTGAGVSGIMRTIDQKSKVTDETLNKAFSDLRALMDNAKEMVELAKQIGSIQNKLSSNETSQLTEYLLSMGIPSPVTRTSAGSMYHSELARQIADFVASCPTMRGGIGMMPLTDVYCLYNRARGTDLISPGDLYEACRLFAPLSLVLRLRTFDSGVAVIQWATHSDRLAADNICKLVRSLGHATAVDIATRCGSSLSVAREQLLRAENEGLLCRDSSFEGLVFYPNFFVTGNTTIDNP